MKTQTNNKQQATREAKYIEYINLINCFETKEAKYYWIASLPCCEAIKGFLCVYFQL